MEQDYRPSKDIRDAIVVWSGTTTSAGLIGGTTLVDTVLTHIIEKSIRTKILAIKGWQGSVP